MLVDKTFLADFETERVGGGWRKSRKWRRELDEKSEGTKERKNEKEKGAESKRLRYNLL